MSWTLISPILVSADRGNLSVIEESSGLPFRPQRVFWVTDVPAGETRGYHAHKSGHQVLFCLRGSISAVFYDGRRSETIALIPGGPGVWMTNLTWSEQTFLGVDSIMLVLCSNEYEEQDYLRDLAAYEKLVEES